MYCCDCGTPRCVCEWIQRPKLFYQPLSVTHAWFIFGIATYLLHRCYVNYGRSVLCTVSSVRAKTVHGWMHWQDGSTYVEFAVRAPDVVIRHCWNWNREHIKIAMSSLPRTDRKDPRVSAKRVRCDGLVSENLLLLRCIWRCPMPGTCVLGMSFVFRSRFQQFVWRQWCLIHETFLQKASMNWCKEGCRVLLDGFQNKQKDENTSRHSCDEKTENLLCRSRLMT